MSDDLPRAERVFLYAASAFIFAAVVFILAFLVAWAGEGLGWWSV